MYEKYHKRIITGNTIRLSKTKTNKIMIDNENVKIGSNEFNRRLNRTNKKSKTYKNNYDD